MSKMISIPADFLTKTANFVKRAGPELEQSRTEAANWQQRVPELVDSLIHVGVLRGEKRAEAIRDFAAGGLTKAADVISILADRVTAPVIGKGAESTKQANVTGTGKRESDQVFEDIILS